MTNPPPKPASAASVSQTAPLPASPSAPAPKPARGRKPAPAADKGGATQTGRGDETRQKLLLTAIDVFGRMGYEGATTRQLAAAAGVNLQAIPYHFGVKSGLYMAAAAHIGDRIAAHLEKPLRAADKTIGDYAGDKRPLPLKLARKHLDDILNTLADVFILPESASWARFMIREQMEPTEAFRRVYRGALKPVLETIGQLVGPLLRLPPDDEMVKLRTLSLVGGIVIFRLGRAAAMAHLDWQEIGHSEFIGIRAMIADTVASLCPRGTEP